MPFLLNLYRRSFTVLFKLIPCIFILFCPLTAALSNARAADKIGVLYSYQNADSYSLSHIVNFDNLWRSFLETFEKANLNYQFICNISPDTSVSDVGVEVIFFPLALDLDKNEKDFLKRFTKSGGKLIISPGVGTISVELKEFLSELGIKIQENKIVKGGVNLDYRGSNFDFELPAVSFYSLFDLDSNFKKTIASWRGNNGPAIGSIKNIIYIGYSWGQDTETQNDVNIFLETIDYVWKDISYKLTRKITKNEFKKITKEINLIKSETEAAIKIAEQLNILCSQYKIKKHLDNGNDYFGDFNTNYLLENYKIARENADSAKSEFSYAYSLCIPSRKVEVRAIWLDRRTIAVCKSPNELRKLIKNLAEVGFNIIFFETVNAGYPIYPSRLLPQNPLIKDWDPLAVAVEAAHAYKIELHAWVWTFAVGNVRHNLLIGKSPEYPGPVISTKGRWWSLATKDGRLRVEAQPEFWVSPANKQAVQFLQELFLEIVQNYDIDGFQFDYIRFPFQKADSQVGFDFVTKNTFKAGSGVLPELSGGVNKIWLEWKINLISNFVKETSKMLRKIKPNLNISAAVFAIDRSQRLQQIQQDWETWLVNKWVDAVYPFYYSYSKEETINKLKNSKTAINNKGVIIPGFNLRVLSSGEFAERITHTRNTGTLGIALFASEHLNPEKAMILGDGPFRDNSAITPFSNPLKACQILIEEFSLIIGQITSKSNISVLAESQTQKDIYYLTDELKKDFLNYSPERINEIERKLTELQLKVKDWLSLEKYLNREQRVMYISSYLDQIITLINFINSGEF